MVDFGTNTMAADIRMQGKREVESRRILKKEEIRPEEAVIEKLRKLHNAKNEEELLAAIGSKAIVLGEVAITALKFGSNRALTFVDNDPVVFIHIPQYVITGNRMATFRHDIFFLRYL